MAAFLFLLASFAHAQDWQFLFDARGNLLVQTAEIRAPPQILGQPQDVVVVPGESASFSVVAADTRAISYQWRFNGTNIIGAINDALLLENVGAANEGQYSVVLVNPSGSVTSAPALLRIDGDADGLPDSWELTSFGSVTPNATADFDGDGVSNQEEFLEGTNPASAASYRPRLRIQTVPYGLGVVFASPGGPPNYALGQVVTLTAMPLPFVSFLGWTGAVTGVKTQISLVMTAHKTVTANFGLVEPPVFESVNAVGGGGGTFSFTWSTVPGRRYQVQFKVNLNDAVWNDLGGPITASDSRTSLNDAIGVNPRRFYRVGLLP